MIQKGDLLPAGTVKTIDHNNIIHDLSVHTACKEKKVLIFGVPGAFTPTCSMYHIPSFVKFWDKFCEKGLHVICIAVNDPYVLGAWSKQFTAPMTFWSDWDARWLSQLGLTFNGALLGLGERAKRFVLYARDLKVQWVTVEEEPSACKKTEASQVLFKLET